MLPHDVIGNRIDRIRRDRTLVEIDVFHAILSRQGLGHLVLIAHLQIDQCLTDAQVLGLGVLQRLVNFLGIEKFPLRQDFAQPLLLLGHVDASFSASLTPAGDRHKTKDIRF